MAKLHYMAGLGDGDAATGGIDPGDVSVAPPVAPVFTSQVSSGSGIPGVSSGGSFGPINNPLVELSGMSSTQLAILGGGALIALALLMPSGGSRRR